MRFEISRRGYEIWVYDNGGMVVTSKAWGGLFGATRWEFLKDYMQALVASINCEKEGQDGKKD